MIDPTGLGPSMPKSGDGGGKKGGGKGPGKGIGGPAAGGAYDGGSPGGNGYFGLRSKEDIEQGVYRSSDGTIAYTEPGRRGQAEFNEWLYSDDTAQRMLGGSQLNVGAVSRAYWSMTGREMSGNDVSDIIYNLTNAVARISVRNIINTAIELSPEEYLLNNKQNGLGIKTTKQTLRYLQTKVGRWAYNAMRLLSMTVWANSKRQVFR